MSPQRIDKQAQSGSGSGDSDQWASEGLPVDGETEWLAITVVEDMLDNSGADFNDGLVASR